MQTPERKTRCRDDRCASCKLEQEAFLTAHSPSIPACPVCLLAGCFGSLLCRASEGRSTWPGTKDTGVAQARHQTFCSIPVNPSPSEKKECNSVPRLTQLGEGCLPRRRS